MAAITGVNETLWEDFMTDDLIAGNSEDVVVNDQSEAEVEVEDLVVYNKELCGPSWSLPLHFCFVSWNCCWSHVGMEYGVERVRGIRDWKNAMLGGALTGALVSAVGNNNKDKVLMDALTGGAIAAAAEFLSYRT